MDTKIDWLSFTFNWDNDHVENDAHASSVVCDTLNGLIGDDMYLTLMGEGGFWTSGKGRKPYSASMRSEGVSIFFNNKISHALVEISGKGCTEVFSTPGGAFLLQTVKDRVTRLDIAVDIETDVTPSEFVTYRNATRHKSFSHIMSDTGETCYIGSMTSNRYCRVYRYNEPHPRAGLLRIEHVFRSEDARIAIDHGFERGVDSLVRQCGMIYGWQHDVWELEPPTERELTAHRVERTEAGTLNWLIKTVVPAVGKMWKEGRKEDVQSFMKELGKVFLDPDNKPVDRLGD